MAENTKNQTASQSTSSNGSTPPACEIAGCVYHIEGTTSSGRKSGDTKVFKYRTHFKNMSEVYTHAAESMQRVVAYRARTGKALPVRSDNSFVDIDHLGNFVETYDDLIDKLKLMSESERQSYADTLRKQLDAAIAAQSVGRPSAKTS